MQNPAWILPLGCLWESVMTAPAIILVSILAALVVIYVAYRIGRLLLRVFIGLSVLALLSWWLWNHFHS